MTIRVLLLGLALIWGDGASPAIAQTVIGGETSVSVPQTAFWNGIVNLRPGANETVTLNPPIFSWFYAPGSPTNSAYDKTNYIFQFQADYSGTFTKPVLDVRTLSSTYNFVAPFTNSPVYWRIGYLTTNGATNVWITNIFFIAPNSKVWDRSMLADTNYIAAKLTNHPHFFFNSGNRAALYQFLLTNNPAQLAAIKNYAQDALTNSWWTNGWGTSLVSNPDEDTRGQKISTVAFLWQMTGDGKWTNGLVNCFSNMAQYHQEAKRWQRDYSQVSNPLMLRALCFGYDWLYPMLPQPVRTNTIAALRKIVRMNLDDLFWRTPINPAISIYPSGQSDPTGEYSGPYGVPYCMFSKRGASHPSIIWSCTWLVSLAALEDDPDAASLFNLGVNYQLGRMTPYGMEAINRGRSYGYAHTFSHGTIENTLMIHMTFPEFGITNHPAFAKLADWWGRMVPPGFQNQVDLWGDYNLFQIPDFWRRPWIGRDFAFLTASGKVRLQIDEAVRLFGAYSGADPYWDSWITPFYFAYPAAETNTTLSACFREDGWVTASQYPPNTAAAFSNGVGLVFAARPQGSEMNHSHLNDLDVEIWAYGAMVSYGQGGSSYAARSSWMYNTVQVDGRGMVQTIFGPRVPIHSRIIAYTNAPDFMYAAGDSTYAYPHELFPRTPEGGTDNPSGYYLADSNFALPYLTKMQRHVIFPHHKYLVIYDDMTTTTNATFSWVYHVQRDVNNLNGGTFSYQANVFNPPVRYPWTNVDVYVSQVVSPLRLSVNKMSGTNAYRNPITGQDLYSYALADAGAAVPFTNSIWVSNLTPTTNFHFMTVIFPVKPGDSAPTITRLDDYTVAVTNGLQGDVITFDRQTRYPATLIVDSPYVGTNAPARRPSNPQELHVR